MRYALIENGLVATVVEQNSIPEVLGEWVEAGDAGPGWSYANGTFTPPPPYVDPVSSLIDIGAFLDRFQDQKMVVLMSADPRAQALVKDIQVRKWIDLSRPDVAQGIQMLGTFIPGITAEVQARVLATPVDPSENMALRRVYFS